MMKFIFTLVFLSFPSFAHLKCTSYISDFFKKEVRYCIETPDSQLDMSNFPVVFYFHGLDGDHNSWKMEGYSQRYQELLAAKKIRPFIVVSFETDPKSFFVDHPIIRKRKFATWFEIEFLPFITQSYDLCKQRECRGLLGNSMGGFGALQTALRLSHIFSFVAAHAPALINQSPFYPYVFWYDYFNRHPIGPFKGFLMLQMVREKLLTPKNFHHTNPFDLLEKARNFSPAIYVDVGGRDEFGFQEGYFNFVRDAEEMGFNVEKYFDPNANHIIQKITMNKSFDFISKQLSKFYNY